MTIITHHKNGEIKTLVEEAPYHPGYEDAGFKPKSVNNEPVAWLIQAKTWHEFTFDKPSEDNENEAIEVEPLYTHPVKELTDEEIEFLYENTTDSKDFARAILKKAQEK